jgi:ribonuclease HII
MGYSVPEHSAALRALGPTVHHRRSFAPVALAHARLSPLQNAENDLGLAPESMLPL